MDTQSTSDKNNVDFKRFLINMSIFNEINKLQVLVNDSWTRLNKSLEINRNQFLETNNYITLYTECKSTFVWINDKENVLKSVDFIDCENLSGWVELRRRLFNLNSDLKAIEARVEDISKRTKNVVNNRDKKLFIGINDESKSRLQSGFVKNLIKEHSKLVKRWMNFKENVKQKVNQLKSEGSINKFLDRLDYFQNWLSKLKMKTFLEKDSTDFQVK